MAKRPGTNKNNYDETQSVFLALGRLEFATHGYSGASTNRIVEQSGMARGSLYYHFKDKEDLFRCIFKNLTRESNDEIGRHIANVSDPFEAVILAADLFLEHALDPTFRRIVGIEALVAMPYLERISITGDTYARTMTTLFERMVVKGDFPKDTNVRNIVLMVYGILGEYARSLEYVDNPEATKISLMTSFRWLLTRMRTREV